MYTKNVEGLGKVYASVKDEIYFKKDKIKHLYYVYNANLELIDIQHSTLSVDKFMKWAKNYYSNWK